MSLPTAAARAHFDPQPAVTCPACGSSVFMSPAHDALACLRCDAWLESPCPGPCWAQCSTRPVRPSLVQSRLYKSAAGDPGIHFNHRLTRCAARTLVGVSLEEHLAQDAAGKKAPSAEDGAGWFLVGNGQKIVFSSEAERDRFAQSLRELEQRRCESARLPVGLRAIDFFLAGRSMRRKGKA